MATPREQRSRGLFTRTAAGNLKILRERMTPTQIAEAQALATEMWEKINN